MAARAAASGHFLTICVKKPGVLSLPKILLSIEPAPPRPLGLRRVAAKSSSTDSRAPAAPVENFWPPPAAADADALFSSAALLISPCPSAAGASSSEKASKRLKAFYAVLKHDKRQVRPL